MRQACGCDEYEPFVQKANVVKAGEHKVGLKFARERPDIYQAEPETGLAPLCEASVL